MDECNDGEDDEHGDDEGSGGLPAELQSREQRIAKLRAVRKQLEAERGTDLRPKSQKSFADPDANMMMTGEGSLQYCYNAQAATSEDGILVAAEITTSPRDVWQEEAEVVGEVLEGAGDRLAARQVFRLEVRAVAWDSAGRTLHIELA